MATLGARIRSRREAKGYSQTEFARLVGSTTRTLQRYEAGAPVPSDLLMRIAAELGVSEHRLLHGSPDLEDVVADVLATMQDVVRRIEQLEQR